MSESHRQSLSGEKLVSKLLFSIQAFTYTCCSEGAEARRLLRDSKASDMPSLLSKFGISGLSLDGNLLLLPKPKPSGDDGFQPFDGRLGKLRYLGLALMVATSPVSMEVVQLCISFPSSSEPEDPFNFESFKRHNEKSSIRKRAPVAYPILCGHVLTHTTGTLLAVTGRARTEEGKYDINSVVDDCRNFIQLGLVARVAQVIIAELSPHYGGDPAVWDQQIYIIIEQNDMLPNDSSGTDTGEREWTCFGIQILRALLSPAKMESQEPAASCQEKDNRISSQIMQTIESAKVEAIAFLRDLSLICQILMPTIFVEDDMPGGDNSTPIFERLMQLFHIENLGMLMKSDLLQNVITSWYEDFTGKSSNLLDFQRSFKGPTWPVSPFCITRHQLANTNDIIPPTCLPLLGKCATATSNDYDSFTSRILYLPKSYTDLYAQLSEMCPDSEQTALCLVCGQVSLHSRTLQCTELNTCRVTSTTS